MPRSISGMGRRSAGTAVALSVATVTAAGLLSGCGAGQVTQTGQMVAAVPGISVDSTDQQRSVSLRDLTVAYPGSGGYRAGGTAPLAVRIFNNRQDRAITLTGVQVIGGATGGTVILAGSGVPATGSASPAAVPPAGPPAAGTPSPSAVRTSPASRAPASVPASAPAGSPAAPPAASSPAPAPGGNGRLSVTIPPSGFVLLVPGSGRYLAITGLTSAYGAGQTVSLRFAFDGGLTVDALGVPIAPPDAPLPRSPLPMGSGVE